MLHSIIAYLSNVDNPTMISNRLFSSFFWLFLASLAVLLLLALLVFLPLASLAVHVFLTFLPLAFLASLAVHVFLTFLPLAFLASLAVRPSCFDNLCPM